MSFWKSVSVVMFTYRISSEQNEELRKGKKIAPKVKQKLSSNMGISQCCKQKLPSKNVQFETMVNNT